MFVTQSALYSLSVEFYCENRYSCVNDKIVYDCQVSCFGFAAPLLYATTRTSSALSVALVYGFLGGLTQRDVLYLLLLISGGSTSLHANWDGFTAERCVNWLCKRGKGKWGEFNLLTRLVSKSGHVLEQPDIWIRGALIASEEFLVDHDMSLGNEITIADLNSIVSW